MQLRAVRLDNLNPMFTVSDLEKVRSDWYKLGVLKGFVIGFICGAIIASVIQLIVWSNCI